MITSIPLLSLATVELVHFYLQYLNLFVVMYQCYFLDFDDYVLLVQNFLVCGKYITINLRIWDIMLATQSQQSSGKNILEQFLQSFHKFENCFKKKKLYKKQNVTYLGINVMKIFKTFYVQIVKLYEYTFFKKTKQIYHVHEQKFIIFKTVNYPDIIIFLKYILIYIVNIF